MYNKGVISLCAFISCLPFCFSSTGEEDPNIIRRLDELDIQLRKYQDEVQELRAIVSNQERVIVHQSSLLETLQVWQKSVNVTWHRRDFATAAVRRQIGGGIAFTAYLDHTYDLSDTEHVVFNKVLFNDGTGYNPSTGIFVCQEPGVYLFTFVVSSRQAKVLACALMVNGQLQLNAVADSFHPGQGIQGSNSLIVRLRSGDQVWVERHGGNHIEGDPSYRYSSFSGVYLYN